MAEIAKRQIYYVLGGLFWAAVVLVLIMAPPGFLGCSGAQREAEIGLALKAQQTGCVLVRSLQIGGSDARDVCVGLDEVRKAIEILREATPTQAAEIHEQAVKEGPPPMSAASAVAVAVAASAPPPVPAAASVVIAVIPPARVFPVMRPPPVVASAVASGKASAAPAASSAPPVSSKPDAGTLQRNSPLLGSVVAWGDENRPDVPTVR